MTTPHPEYDQEILQLPRTIGDGLVLRWGVPEDAEALGKFNVAIHSDNPQEPDSWLLDWTKDLMGGGHPTTSAGDFTVVVDERAGSKIVSSLNLISQTWSFDGMPFGVGRIELVGTDPHYRRRGLISAQMAVVHALSASRGELVQSITGIPWYYRQFGYEMAINLGGSRAFFWSRPDNDHAVEAERLRLRPVQREDIPSLNALYQQHCGQSLIVHERDERMWNYELFAATRGTPGARSVELIEDEDKLILGYANFWARNAAFVVRELGVKEGHSWREIALFLVRTLRLRADQINAAREKPVNHISFNLGERHALYEALDPQLEKSNKPYAWYIRLADLQAFLRLVTPVLEKRLSKSVMAGFTGRLRLNMYRSGLVITFTEGRVAAIDSYTAKSFDDADAVFPDLTFLQLLFGYRSFDELDAAFADCFSLNPQGEILLRILFPRRPSDISPLN